jgi:hypothetical protein
MTDEERELAELRAQLEAAARQIRESAELLHALAFPAPTSEEN